VIGVRGPAVSTDGGQTWTWLGHESVDGQSFGYMTTAISAEIAFSFGMPYTQSNLDLYLTRYSSHPYLMKNQFCVSRKQRPVEMLHIRPPDPKSIPPVAVVITARHHCCEMMASYALEGILSTILSETETGLGLREQAEFWIIPFMDKDGVEDGDQGKNRFPHDHNRDYSGESIYPEVQTLRDWLPAWINQRVTACFDLHCPWIRGEYHEWAYFVGSENQVHWQEIQRFSSILEADQSGILRYRQGDNLPFGTAWNTPSLNGISFSKWVETIPEVRLSAALEIPYANSNGAEVNAQTAALFGNDLAKALGIWIEQIQPEL
jgi:hypothetical protein